MPKTYADGFGGFGGSCLGAIAAGLEPTWTIEIDPQIAEVNKANLGHDVIVADLLKTDPMKLHAPDFMHWSPPCTRASAANSSAELNDEGTKEAPLDMALANKIIEFTEAHLPRVLTLENVWGYRNFQSWKGGRKCEGIQNALHRLGYWVSVKHVNCADFGGIKLCPIHDSSYLANTASVAANHYRREIAPDIAAAFATMPPDAQAMRLAWDAVHHLASKTGWDTAGSAGWRALENAQAASAGQRITPGRGVDISTNADMFVSGSMENIDANIVSLLKRCLDAPLLREKWFIISTETKRITLLTILECIRATGNTRQSIIPKGMGQTQTGELGTNGARPDCPLCRHEAVPQTRKRMIVRAVRGGFVPYMPQPVPWNSWYAAIEDLIDTLPESRFANWQLARLPALLQATLVAQSGLEGRIGLTAADVPSPTVTANHNQLGIKAFLMPGGGNTNFAEAHAEKGCRYDDEPAHTVTAVSKEGGAMPRAWLVDGQNASPTRHLTIRDADEPSMTVTNQGKGYARSLLSSGRVVAMTSRALARFQSFSDAYELPDNARLAAKGIGNAAPPLMMQRIYEHLLEAL